MEIDCQEDETSGSVCLRHRSPSFTKDEVKTLLNIIEKYKTIVFNKSTSSAAVHAKEAAWSKIAKMFNSQGFKHMRTIGCLKNKWDNLKRDARKVTKTDVDVKHPECDDLIGQMVTMMCKAENTTSVVGQPEQSDGETNENGQNEDANNESEAIDSDDSIGDSENARLMKNRSLNFSPQECTLLLQCVKREKHIILSKATSSGANKIKNRAWTRITNSYNKLSPQKRSTKVLRTKFTNMKRLARIANFKGYFGKKHMKLEESGKKIKPEPIFEYGGDLDADIDGDNDGDDQNVTDQDSRNHSSQDNPDLDPLRYVLSSDSGMSSISTSENKEVVELKLKLLNYKLETAKLQRKRIEDLARAETKERETKLIENSLRLRAARLEAIAAEMKLPPSLPSLAYTAEETRAQHYIHQYHAT